ncbi:translation initiation factor eif-2b subunit beta [Citrus sinensis]|uniref:Translation initiation factor eif-2b subunit beta n=1 Tax=Citrus sinensis TaxID=2711 RepID=A0ACB8IQ49_CITSI|nr:translation initiation factor eif-2b subunit beta [Citrus sinensis]
MIDDPLKDFSLYFGSTRNESVEIFEKVCSSLMNTRAAFFPPLWKASSFDHGDWSRKKIRCSIGFSFDVSYFEFESRERLRPPCKLSRTVSEFLFAAKEKKRSFRVFVAEGAPRYQGHLLAKELVARGLQTTLITDSAVFAMISRVNMVIVGAHAVMANGGVIAPVGMNLVALAAQKHAVPFVVLAGSHKLCPLYPHNPEVLLNELRSPSELLDFGEFSDCMDFGSGSGSPLLHVVNPAFDYVPPKLVSLFITDAGGHNPSYMYRLIADYYSADDLVVQRRAIAGN